MLGQTRERLARCGSSASASMEGRAIARPNRGMPRPAAVQWRAEQLLGQTTQTKPTTRSMSSRFNGGPSNCSAKLAGRSGALRGAELFASMEGRAIARPNLEVSQRGGDTRSGGFNGGPSNCSAKPARRGTRRLMRWRFNGGPSNCSAKHDTHVGRNVFELQWRAEQLLGQTRTWETDDGAKRGFNGGPSNCSAKPSKPSTL